MIPLNVIVSKQAIFSHKHLPRMSTRFVVSSQEEVLAGLDSTDYAHLLFGVVSHTPYRS